MAVNFSQRNRPVPTTLKYEIPEHVCNRVLAVFEVCCDNNHIRFQNMLSPFYQRAMLRYGGLHLDPPAMNPDVTRMLINHFKNCPTDRAIDFIEWCFESPQYGCGQEGVDAINNIFREEGIGFEFSRYVDGKEGMDSHGRVRKTVDQYPQATMKSNEVLHATTVMPALQLLSQPIWKGANEEMLQAHQHLRAGNYADAITWAGKCLESVLQIICDTKNWTFVPDKDTLNRLLQTCYMNKLFDAPYIDVLQKSSGEIRNKWGGHGTAKSAHGPATFQMAEHMIQLTSAHVVLLAKMAGITS